MSVYTDNDDQLCCPLCGDVFVHVDAVQVAARPDGEDGPIAGFRVTSTGSISGRGDVPVGPHAGEGRRHRIALTGWCEMCEGHFALVFTQHKGVTIVESVPLTEAEAA